MTDKLSNKTKQKSAVGIKYHQSNDANQIKGNAPSDGTPSGSAPTIIAKGFGDLADEIIALARRNGVLVHEDPYLSDFLATLDLGQEIPDQLYHVIAELISFSYVLQGKFPDSWAKMHNKVSKKV
ncbi:MAG: flagellar biosynthesis protein [Flavobacteriales bacterium]|jgi:flagellar biosynthesis protein